MKVGDLIKHVPSGTVGLIVVDNVLWSGGHEILVQWCDDIKEIEDIDNYEGDLEIINESG